MISSLWQATVIYRSTAGQILRLSFQSHRDNRLMSERAQSAAPDGPSHGWCRCIQIDLRGAKVALLVVLLCSTHVVCAQNPCAAIRQLCENAGFVQGAAESGNGLQRDCIQPIMQASAPPNHSSRPLPAVDPQLVEACKAARPDFGHPGSACQHKCGDRARWRQSGCRPEHGARANTHLPDWLDA
jgi:hypothetical protein